MTPLFYDYLSSHDEWNEIFYYSALNETEMHMSTPDTRLSICFALEKYRSVDNNLNEGNR